MNELTDVCESDQGTVFPGPPPGTAISVGLSTDVPWLVAEGDNPVTDQGVLELNSNFSGGGGTLYLDDAGNFTSPPGAGSGSVTSITGTGPIVVTPSPITTTGDISLADTAVTPGSYTLTNLTVDGKGRITAASNGTGGSTVTPAALTKSDDTNVTLTLGGTPATALLQATLLTLGWAGTLAIARGGWGKAMTDPNADRLTIWDDTDGDFQFVTVGTGLTYTHATHTLAATATAQTRAVTFVCDGSGSAVTTGTKSYTKIPYGGTLTGWLLIGSPSGSVTVDIFRAADGAGLPVTSIVGAGTKPALSSAVENSSTSFGSWTSTTLNAKDNLAISLSGITSTTYVALTLYFS